MSLRNPFGILQVHPGAGSGGERVHRPRPRREGPESCRLWASALRMRHPKEKGHFSGHTGRPSSGKIRACFCSAWARGSALQHTPTPPWRCCQGHGVLAAGTGYRAAGQRPKSIQKPRGKMQLPARPPAPPQAAPSSGPSPGPAGWGAGLRVGPVS